MTKLGRIKIRVWLNILPYNDEANTLRSNHVRTIYTHR